MTLIDRAQAFIAPFEGRVPYMYLDTEGYVTVGVGAMLPTPQAAIALVWKWRDRVGEPNEIEIADEWLHVHSQQKGLVASAYKMWTTMDLVPSEIDRLFTRRLHDFSDALERIFPVFPDWPEDAQLATVDMAYNLGSAAIPRHWPKLTEALHTQNWRAAADECRRPQAHEGRNLAVRALYLSAANAGAIPTGEV